MARVIVLHARLDPGPVEGNPVPGTGFRARDAGALAALLAKLPYAKRLELERREPAGRYTSLAGIRLVLDGAALITGRRAAPSALRFPADGKPYFDGGPHFSISHAASRVAVALSDEIDIGIDIEDLGRPLPGDDDARRKLTRWTATEAVLKAAGLGLRDARSVELDEMLTTGRLDGTAYRLTPLVIAPDVVACLASPQGASPPSVEVSLVEVPF